MTTVLGRLAALFLLAWVAYGTLLPGTGVPFGFYMPWLTHLSVFCLLALVAWSVVQPSKNRRWVLALALAVFAVGTEIAQLWVPAREPSVSDALLNLIGVGLASAGSWLWLHWFTPPETIEPFMDERPILPANAAGKPAPELAELVQQMNRHRLIPALAVLRPLDLIDDEAERLLAPIAKRSRDALRWRRDWEDEVFAAFEKAQIRTLVLKGAALARWLYPDPECRPRVDLDLLVGPDGKSAARALLEAEGYRCTGTTITRSQETWQMDAEPGPRIIDLHFHLTDQPALTSTFDFEELWEQRVPMFEGSGCVHRLNAEFALIHAVVHYIASDPRQFRADLGLLEIARLREKVENSGLFLEEVRSRGLRGLLMVASAVVAARLPGSIRKTLKTVTYDGSGQGWRTALAQRQRSRAQNFVLGCRGQHSIVGILKFIGCHWRRPDTWIG